MSSRIAPYIPQVRSHSALGKLIAQGAGARLPQLNWTIAADTGMLAGEVPLGVASAELRSATFNAWSKLLRAEGRPGVLCWDALFTVEEEGQPIEGVIRMVVLAAGADA